MIKEARVGILAGGKGLRLGEQTKHTQKCLLPIDGKPILLHIMDSLVEAFGSAVVLNMAVSHEAEQVVEFVQKNLPSKDATVNFVFDEGVGTWNAFHNLKGLLHGEFVGVPGDVVTHPEVYREVMDFGTNNDYPVVMSFSPNLDEAITHDLGLLEKNVVVDLIKPDEKIDISSYLRLMNIYYGSERLFELIEKFPQTKIGGILSNSFVDALDGKQPLGGMITEKAWIHVAYPNDLLKCPSST